MKKYELTGRRFGRLLVVDKKDGKWNCICDCGNKRRLQSNILTEGRAVSCGCLKAEKAKMRMTTHGCTGTSTWNCWRGLFARCENPKEPSYKNYGGRGISVCSEWRSFEKFLTDMGKRPFGMTIERKDVNGNYCNSNCIWLPKSLQSRNKRNTIYVELASIRMPVVTACEILGVKYKRVMDRVRKLGWSIERALNEKKRINQFG